MRLKLISLNLWMHVNWKGRKPDIIAFLREQDADIILLQEVRHEIDKDEKPTSEQLQEALGYPHHHYGQTMDLNVMEGTPDLPSRSEGLAIISKHPLRAEMIMLRSTPDDKFTRGALHARVECDPVVDVFNVHFSPHDKHSMKQYEETLRLAKERGVLPVIAGDFNILQAHLVEMRCKPHWVSSSENHDYVSYPSEDRTLDYILVPKEYRMEGFLCPDVELSDHRPLIAVVSTA